MQLLFTEHLLCPGARELGCQQSSTDVGPEPEGEDPWDKQYKIIVALGLGGRPAIQ